MVSVFVDKVRLKGEREATIIFDGLIGEYGITFQDRFGIVFKQSSCKLLSEAYQVIEKQEM